MMIDYLLRSYGEIKFFKRLNGKSQIKMVLEK